MTSPSSPGLPVDAAAALSSAMTPLAGSALRASAMGAGAASSYADVSSTLRVFSPSVVATKSLGAPASCSDIVEIASASAADVTTPASGSHRTATRRRPAIRVESRFEFRTHPHVRARLRELDSPTPYAHNRRTDRRLNPIQDACEDRRISWCEDRPPSALPCASDHRIPSAVLEAMVGTPAGRRDGGVPLATAPPNLE